VPGDKVVVKLTADGRKCACTRASVCGSRQAYEARYGEESAAAEADRGGTGGAAASGSGETGGAAAGGAL